VNGLTSNRSTIRTSQKDKASGNLRGLRRTTNRRGKLLLSLLVHGSRDQGRPHWTRSDGVDTNATTDILVRQTAGKTDDGALCGCVVEQIRTTNVSIDAGVVDDGVTLVHMRQSVFGQVKEGVDVCLESKLPLLLGQVDNILNHVLVGRIVYQDVDCTHLFQGRVDNLLAILLFLQVDLQEMALLSVRLDFTFCLLGILLFDSKVGDQAVSAFHGVHDGDCTANARVTACDDCLFALEFAGGFVEGEAAIFRGEVLVLGGGTFELGLEAWWLLVCYWDLEICLGQIR
jgi:hypothetical protein